MYHYYYYVLGCALLSSILSSESKSEHTKTVEDWRSFISVVILTSAGEKELLDVTSLL